MAQYDIVDNAIDGMEQGAEDDRCGNLARLPYGCFERQGLFDEYDLVVILSGYRTA